MVPPFICWNAERLILMICDMQARSFTIKLMPMPMDPSKEM
uniref:Uncharacterized protein n=1 Tax=Anguilla anguilla TaxID=7936 RepID=A0A0E9WJX8_ANGAN